MPQGTGDHAAAPGADLLDDIARRGVERPCHLGPAAAVLGRALAGGGAKVAITAPPHHGKRTLAVHAAASVLDTRRRATVGYFTATWASAQGAAIRIAQATTVAMHSKDQRRVWTSPDGSSLLIGAVGNSVELFPRAFDVLLIVNPVKSDAEAADTDRLRAQWLWLQKLRGHLAPEGSLVILGARWNTADLIGCALREGGWDHVNLPALNARGEPLWPAAWSAAVLTQIRACIGARAWAALYMGQPVEERRVPPASRAAGVAEHGGR